MPFNCVSAAVPAGPHDVLPGGGPFAAGGPDTDLPGPPVILVPPAHPLRHEAEACIRAVYEQAFGARDFTLPHMLIAWADRDGRPLCAAGLRTAAYGFFSEVYLDAPIEQVLSVRGGRPVAREDVFEITTLASRRAEVSTAFLRALAHFGKGAGFSWSFFTATFGLRKLLAGLRIPAIELAPADPRRVADPGRWGSYYAHAPRVCAVDDRWLVGTALHKRGELPNA